MTRLEMRGHYGLLNLTRNTIKKVRGHRTWFSIPNQKFKMGFSLHEVTLPVTWLVWKFAELVRSKTARDWLPEQQSCSVTA